MAYKVFANGFPLPASDLNNFLMNQSVIVFADNAARSGAIASPVEGMITYLESTQSYYFYDGSDWLLLSDSTGPIPNSTVTTAGDLIVADGNASVTRLGIGSSGQVLGSNGTTATWVNPYSVIDSAGDLIVGTGSDAVTRLPIGSDGQALLSNGTTAVWGTPSANSMTLISSTSLSGVSTTLSSIPSTYKNLVLVIQNYDVSAAVQPRIRFNSDTGNNYYNWTSAQSEVLDTNTGFFELVSRDVAATGAETQIKVSITEYSSSSNIKLVEGLALIQASSTTAYGFSQYGGYRNSGAINSITIYTDDAVSTHAGTALLYGVK